jgi:hypothetical protein
MPSRAGKKLLKAAEARPHTDASTLGVLTNFVLNLRGPSYISNGTHFIGLPDYSKTEASFKPFQSYGWDIW